MTICYPNIIQSTLCPRDELSFSPTPPTCVRVVPLYQDISFLIGQFPPPVHFVVSDSGYVYQLAPITSPPTVPPEYHALLDSTGCVLVGVELPSSTNAGMTDEQINVLPGVLRYVLQTLSLPITSVTNALPVERCRRRLWDNVIIPETVDCLSSPPPPPPTPPSLSCAFVLSCLNAGQNINISGGGLISAGSLVQGPAPGEYSWLLPNGTPAFSFTPGGTFTVLDTTTIDLTFALNVLSANVRVSSNPGNIITVLPDGLYVPSGTFTVSDTNTIDLTFALGVLSANVLIDPAPTNQLVATPNGLFVPPGGNSPCIGLLTLPPVLPLGSNTHWIIWNDITRCLEVPAMPYGAMPYYRTNGEMAHAYLYYSDIGHNVLLDFGSSTLLATSGSILVTQGYTGSSTYTIGSVTATSISIGISYSLINLTSSSVSAPSTSSLLLGSIATFGGVSGSLCALISSGVGQTEYSVVTANNASVSRALHSLITAGSKTNIGDFNGVTTSVVAYRNTSLAPSVNGLNEISSSIVLGNDLQSANASSYVRYSSLIANNGQYSTIENSDVFITNGGGVSNSSYSEVFVDRGSIIDAQSSNIAMRGAHTSSISAFGSVVKVTGGSVGRGHITNPVVSTNSVALTRNHLVYANQSFYAEENPTFIGYVYQSVVAVQTLVSPDPTPGLDSFTISNGLLLCRNGQIIAPGTSKVNFVGVGDNIVVHRDTIIAVGGNTPTSGAIESAGGWQIAFTNPVGSNIFEMWGNYPHYFNVQGSYANDAAASSTLNTSYGTDPRTKVGTMVVVTVSGRPAIFAWDGASFVRITV